MILEIIGALLLVFVIAFIVNTVENVKKKDKISFKEAMDLIELPVVTLYFGKSKANFIIDTGCDISCISPIFAKKVAKHLNDSGRKSVAADGNVIDVLDVECDFTLKNTAYTHSFNVREGLNEAFDIIKQENGVSIHGLMGSDFLNKYNYIIDYKDYKFYKK